MPTYGWIIIAVLAVIVIWAIATYNALIKLRNDSEEAFSTMDVFLKKRFDLIPNLVETVKGYAKHEASTLENVIKARNMGIQASSTEEKINADNMLTGTLKSLFALAEAYPDLKANSNFIDLQNQLKKVEDEIAGSRRYYNAIVNTYNIKTEVFPSSIIAALSHFVKKPLYIINEEQRENVKVQF
jgi:LemA protein